MRKLRHSESVGNAGSCCYCLTKGKPKLKVVSKLLPKEIVDASWHSMSPKTFLHSRLLNLADVA